MTRSDAWHVARRVLGIYFVVQGLVHAAAALGMLGIVVPEGSNRFGYVSAMLLQGAISVAAGAILLRDRFEQSASASPAIDLAATKRGALQLLGVFFLVQGVASFANPTVGIFLVGTDWHFRASQFAEAAVLVISGALLVGRTSRLATVLERRETA